MRSLSRKRYIRVNSNVVCWLTDGATLVYEYDNWTFLESEEMEEKSWVEAEDTDNSEIMHEARQLIGFHDVDPRRKGQVSQQRVANDSVHEVD